MHSIKTVYVKYYQHLEERQCSSAHLKTVAWRLGRYVDQLADRLVTDITSVDLATHFRELKERGLSEASLAGYTSTQRAFWRWCKANAFIKKNPAKALKKHSYKPRHRRPAPPDAVQTVISALPQFARHRGINQRDVRDALLVSLSLDCGGRLGEMWSLVRNDVLQALRQPVKSPSGNVYHITGNGKTGDACLRFCEDTAKLFRQWFEISPRVPSTAGVFVNLQTGERLKPASLGRAFERVCKFAGVPVFRSHAVRKRNISDMIRLAGSPHVGQLYAGHADVSTTMEFYDSSSGDEVDAYAAALANKRRSPNEDDFADGLARLMGLKK